MLRSSKRRSWALRKAIAEALERRVILSNGPVPIATAYSIAESSFQSVDAVIGFSPVGPLTVQAGTYLTVDVTNEVASPVAVFCSYAGATATVDGNPVATIAAGTAGHYDFPTMAPAPDQGAYVNVGMGLHTVVFYIRAGVQTEGITEEDSPDGFVGYYGPWVNVATASFSSSLPFAITNTNQLAFMTQPGNVFSGIPFPTTLQVAVENAAGDVLTDDNDTMISLSLPASDTLRFANSAEEPVVDGVATFTGLEISPISSPTPTMINAASVDDEGDVLTASSAHFLITPDYQSYDHYPQSLTFAVGQDASFTAAAYDSAPATVQWMVETAGSNTFVPVGGATSSFNDLVESTTLDLGPATLAESGNQYEAVFTQSVPDVPGSPFTTGAATLSVTAGTVAPQITQQPSFVAVGAGDDATLTVAAIGSPVPTVQWFSQAPTADTYTPINGATLTTLDIGTATLSESGTEYEAVFTNGVSPDATAFIEFAVYNGIAPVLTANPDSQTVNSGTDVTFSAGASGSPLPTVQWFVEGPSASTFSSISGATSTTLDIGPATVDENGNEYEAVFSNGNTPDADTFAALTVNEAGSAPAISTNPQNQNLTVGQDASFTAAATGTPTPTVQWMVEPSGNNTFSPLSGQTNTTLDLGAATLGESGNEYEAVFSNGVGSPATTNAATLMVSPATAAPVIGTNPMNQNLTVGQDASFTAAATGTPTPTVQWMVELSGGSTFSSLTGQTSATLDLGSATLAENGNKYEAVFSNGIGTPATTNAATLMVSPATAAPVVGTNPMNQNLTVGQDASFTAAATGTPTPTVQWMVELSGGSTFSSLTGQTSATLDLGSATLAENGNKYEAVFSNGVGTPATTNAATLMVSPATAAPVVGTNPMNQNLTVGQDASFTAAATGTPTPTVQWMVELSGGSTFSSLTGQTSATLDLGSATLAENGNKYEAVFSNGVGTPATTNAATLMVSPATAAPVVGTNPMNQNLTVGQDASFTAAASGTPAPTVQWMVELSGGSTFSALTGQTSATLDLGAATLAESGNKYEAVFSNGVGTPATTTAATLTVNPAVSGGAVSGVQAAALPSYNLTQLGGSDWAHWGTNEIYGAFDHKAAGGSQISNVTTVGTGGVYGAWADPSRDVSWTDGTPHAADSGDHAYIWANGALQTGYQFTVPADTSTRTLTVYAGGDNTSSSLTAHLSGGSAGDYVATASATGLYTSVYTITYHAASAGQTLTITLLKTGNLGGRTDGSVDLMAATLSGPAVTTSGGSLSGTQSAAATSYNLTQLGSTDWAHWGTGNIASAFDHKATGGSQISNVTRLGAGSYGSYYDPSRDVSWTDGTPLAGDTGDHAYIWANDALGAGYSFTAPADTVTRTLYIYAGGFSSGGTLTAQLSDGSAAEYTVSASGAGLYTNFYAITYRAASSSQKLIVSYTKTSNIKGIGGSVDLIAAALVTATAV